MCCMVYRCPAALWTHLLQLWLWSWSLLISFKSLCAVDHPWCTCLKRFHLSLHKVFSEAPGIFSGIYHAMLNGTEWRLWSLLEESRSFSLECEKTDPPRMTKWDYHRRKATFVSPDHLSWISEECSLRIRIDGPIWQSPSEPCTMWLFERGPFNSSEIANVWCESVWQCGARLHLLRFPGGKGQLEKQKVKMEDLLII